MSQTKVKSGLISDQSITASKLDVTGNGNSGEVLASAGDGSFVWTGGIATELYTDNAIAALVDSAPGTLDTLNELAAALGDDANFAGTVTTALATKVDGTGTANYISKWSDSDTLTNSVIYDNGTNVGIGTSSPNSYSGYTTLTLNGTSGGFLDFESNGTRVGSFLFNNASGVLKTETAIPLLFATTDVERMRITSTGNVGIGTSSPAVKLQVIENISGWTTWIENTGTGGANSGLIVTAGEDAGDATILLRKRDGTETFTVRGNGNVGIGTSIPATPIDISSESSTIASFRATGGVSNNIRLEIGSGGDRAIFKSFQNTTNVEKAIAFQTGNNERMRIDASGNVGIGTSTPNSTGGYTTLTLNNATSGSVIDFETNGNLVGRLFNTSTSFHVYNQAAGALALGTGGVEKMRISSSGNVGIGTTNPTQFVQIGANFQAKKLYVAGSYNFGGVYIGAVNSNTGSTIEFVSHTGVTTGRSFRVGSNTDLYGSDKLVFEISDSTTTYGGLSYSPKMLLNSLGNLHVDGDVIAYSTTVSDERLKDNITTIDNALDKVCELRGVEYDWNASSRSGQHDMGVIAQEVEKVFPFIVREKEMPLVDGNTYKTVDYEKLVGVLIEAVKELKQEIEILKSK